jgi:hypothetical protein
VSIVAAGVFLALAWKTMRDEKRRGEARIAALAAAIDGAAPPVAPGPAPIFSTGRRSPMLGRPLLKVAFGFAMAVAFIVLVAMTGDRHQVATAEAPARPEPAASLELISMRHRQTGESLTVTGLVRNAGESAGRLTAVVLAFDRGGDFVASGRAPIEFPALGRGDESPFQVTIPGVADVGRYRVSFRTESGVVRHVDRRAGPPAPAAN